MVGHGLDGVHEGVVGLGAGDVHRRAASQRVEAVAGGRGEAEAGLVELLGDCAGEAACERVVERGVVVAELV